MSVYHKRDRCASCGGVALATILDYGKVPLAGYFPDEEEMDYEELFPLRVLFCRDCFLVQTDSVIDADKLFKDYRYMSSIGLSKHFEGVANTLKSEHLLNSFSRVIEIGSNDGVLLKPLMELGIDALGFEPAINIAKVAQDKGCWVINDYFNVENAKRYLGANHNYDLIVSNNCFAHIDDIRGIIEGIQLCLKSTGKFVFEVSYLRDLIEKLQYDNIYHEHIYYYSLLALDNLFRSFGMTIVGCVHIPIHSGSIRVTVVNDEVPKPRAITEILAEEHRLGMDDIAYFRDFSREVNLHQGSIVAALKELKKKGFKVAGYGASGRANMTCNICKLTTDDVEFIVDESPERCGRYIAGSRIPIVSKQHLLDSDVDYVVIFAWNFADMIIEKLPKDRFKFIVFFPEGKVI